MKNEFTLTVTLPASAEEIYEAWLSTNGHSQMTGSPAKVDGRVKGDFTAWDGYIQGTTLELQPYRRILQAWRTTDFPPGSADSRLEVLLEAVEGGVQITLHHSDIPAGQGEEYRQGWEDYYFQPMQAYFSGE